MSNIEGSDSTFNIPYSVFDIRYSQTPLVKLHEEPGGVHRSESATPRIQYGSEREKGKGVLLKRVPPRALMAKYNDINSEGFACATGGLCSLDPR